MVFTMDLEEKILVYSKAGLTSDEILKKLDLELDEYSREKAKVLVYKISEEKKIAKKNRTIILAGLIIFFVLAISVSCFFSFVKDSSFFSVQCNTGKILIDGDAWQRQKIVASLSLIENKNCEYAEFVSDNLTAIHAQKIGGLDAGFYIKGKEAFVDSSKDTDWYTASIIVHEACHSFQRSQTGYLSESECTNTGYNFLKKTLAPEEELKKVEHLSDVFLQYYLGDTDAFEKWKQQRQ